MVQRRGNTTIPSQEEVLAGQIPEYVDEGPIVDDAPELTEQQKLIGTKIKVGTQTAARAEANKQFAEENNLVKIGDNLKEKVEYRDGWLDVDRALLKDRGIYYPEDWKFRIRPATVEAVRNWSIVDDNDGNSVDEALNEILKSCLKIVSNYGTVQWGAINTWDRFFFVLLIREYTFATGENKIEYTETCPNCGEDVTFNLNALSLMYDLPYDDVLKYYDRANRVWTIDPYDFDVQGYDVINLYLPTIDKDIAIKRWMIDRLRENNNAVFDPVFIKFLPWMANRLPKDPAIAAKEIRKYETAFKTWNTEMFSLMDDILKNISVTPSKKISAMCKACGEEVTSDMRFQSGVSNLFTVVNKHRKFGQK